MEKLKNLLETMELPSERIRNLHPNNLRWLQRNIRVRNSEHPQIDEALKLIKALLG